MSWHYLQELEEEFSVENYLDGLRLERSKSKNIHGKFYSLDKKTDIWIDSQYGTILQRLTVDLGKGPLISFPGGSLVKTFPQTEESRRRQYTRAIGEMLSQDDYTRIKRNSDDVARGMDRLKAIGNGQNPAVAALAFTILSDGLI